MGNALATKEALDRLEEELGAMPQADIKTEHYFSPGVYMRLMIAPPGVMVLGHEHATEHFNVVLKGRANVMVDGITSEVVAPAIIKSKVGSRKIALVFEELVWLNVHPTDETNIEKLEEMLYNKTIMGLSLEEMRENSRIEADHKDYLKVVEGSGYTPEQARQMSRGESDLVPVLFPPCFAEVGPSKIEGDGVFATKDFEPGEEIGHLRVGPNRTFLGRYLNHSINHNSRGVIDNYGILLMSIKYISKGEEITTDYRYVATMSRGGLSCAG